jgi:hypothetical protein
MTPEPVREDQQRQSARAVSVIAVELARARVNNRLSWLKSTSIGAIAPPRCSLVARVNTHKLSIVKVS